MTALLTTSTDVSTTTDTTTGTATDTATVQSLPSPRDRYGRGAADRDATDEVVSQHRTSEGTIQYVRDASGDLQVRLLRPDTGEQVLIRASR